MKASTIGMQNAFTLIESRNGSGLSSAYPAKPAFTLIELLVVITIIVVLLALLTPALDKAIYQAELATCGAGLKSVSSGVTTYAIQNKRSYPNRTGGDEAHKISRAGGDDRPKLRPYLSLNGSLQCVLNGEVDIDLSDADSNTYAGYTLWFGWQYTGHAGMHRLGNRFTWTEQATGRTLKFSHIAGDWDQFNFAGRAGNIGSHPDSDGVLGLNEVYQDRDAYLAGIAPAGTGAAKFTIARWGSGNDQRGTLDRNFTYADGSVERLTELVLEDDRTEGVPFVPSGVTDWQQYLPER